MRQKMDRSIEDYKDIIDLPHHVSKKRPQMAIADRAAQFSPFSAVVGHETAIKETARETKLRIELDEMEKSLINDQLREIEANLGNKLEVEITYFVPDHLKSGGAYMSVDGIVKKIDVYAGEIIMVDGNRIDIEEIYRVRIK